jgi:hypothetical protein
MDAGKEKGYLSYNAGYDFALFLNRKSATERAFFALCIGELKFEPRDSDQTLKFDSRFNVERA